MPRLDDMQFAWVEKGAKFHCKTTLMVDILFRIFSAFKSAAYFSKRYGYESLELNPQEYRDFVDPD